MTKKSFMNMVDSASKMDFRDRNLAFIDLEMSGLDLSVHEILEIGIVVADPKSLEILDEKTIKISPTNLEDADPVALSMIEFDIDDWADSVDIKEGLHSLNEIAKDTMLAGWNIAFDWAFLDTAFEKNMIKPTFDYHFLDVLAISYFHFKDKNEPTRLSLRIIARSMGIDVSEVHGALTDARATYEIYKKLTQSI